MRLHSFLTSVKWRLSGYPAEKYRALLSASQCWPRQQIESFREDKLRKLIVHCYENVPYYRRAMVKLGIRPDNIACPQDLARLPILTKETVRSFAPELMARNASQMRVTWSKTGGTTGEPIRVAKNIECTAWSTMCFERGLKWGGKEADEPRILLFGGSLGIDKTSLSTRIGNSLRGNLFLPAFELRTTNAMSYFEKIKRSRCRFLVGYASAIYRLATLAETFNQEINFKAIFPTAEIMLPEWQETIQRIFKCPVLPFYGCGEVQSLGYFPLGEGAYLIPEEHALVEVFDKTGGTQLVGEGRFLITDLDNYAMPIIRYLNGDAGKISTPNGRFPFSRIERLDGRYNSFLLTDTGDLISGVIGTHVFRHTLSVKTYQIIQEEPLRIVIKIVPKNDLNAEDRDLVMRLFTKHLGNRMKITIEKVSDLPLPPSGKSVFVINRCLERSSESAHSLVEGI